MASTLQWFDNFAAWRSIFVTLNRLFVWWIFQNRLKRNDFLQVETEKLLDTEKPQGTSRRVLEWLGGESISPLSNPCLKAIPSIKFQKLKTEQISRLQLWQKRGHIITVKTDELKYFFARTNYDSSINYSRLLLILWRHWYHGVLQVKNTNAVVFWKTCCCCCCFFFFSKIFFVFVVLWFSNRTGQFSNVEVIKVRNERLTP